SSTLLDSLLALSWIHSISGDMQAASEIGERAMVVARVERHGLFEAGVQQAFVQSLAGDFGVSRVSALDALATAERAGVPRSSSGRSRCWSVLAWSAWCLGRYEESLQALEPILSALEGDRHGENAALAAPLLEWLGDRRLVLIDSTRLDAKG